MSNRGLAAQQRLRLAEVPWTLEKEMTAELWVKLTHSWDYGTYRVRIDGRDAGTFDLLNPSVTSTPHKLGTHTLAAGAPQRLRVHGEGREIRGLLFGLDTLTARVPVYARPATKDLRELQAGPR